ncbi:chemotaxis protein CheA [uncultured Oscillibacter sp.]|uniref:chemotaxis protein CheA n=1 Tax=uncultured Oscillibacter sp. TaxID=876091 RepID=UPI0025FF268B|nr:chemotaxis protein CheA [uncultured Oscillibacter sp.]
MDNGGNESILDTYLYETNTLLEQLDSIVLAAEQADTFTQNDVNEIFRIMHTIKGASAMMEYDSLSTVAHRIEDMFFIIREKTMDVIPDEDRAKLFDMMFMAIDFFRAEVEKIQNGESLSNDIDTLMGKINSLVAKIQGDADGSAAQEPAAPAAASAPAAAPAAAAAPAPAGSGEFPFGLRVFFDEGVGMENLRAYMLVNELRSTCGEENFEFSPKDVETNSETSETIIAQGFVLSFRKEVDRAGAIQIVTGSGSVRSYQTFDAAPAAPAAPAAAPAAQSAPAPAAKAAAPATEKKPAADGEKKKPAAPAPSGTQSGAPHVKESLISVNLSKLNQLMDVVGEIVITESMVTASPDLRGLKLDNFTKSARQLRKLTDELQDVSMSLRMVPVLATFQKMQRIVRDMGKKLGKRARLTLIGENTEVDKTIVDSIGDPLMHIVRNSMDHGIEDTEEERIAAGKDPEGEIILSASHTGGEVIIQVKDDGQGVNYDKVLKKAIEKGLASPDTEYSKKEIINFLLAPGFSTNTEVTEFSGRGVGMDVVKKNVEEVGGTVVLTSEPGKGMTTTLKIPLTMAILDGMEVSVGGSIFTIPINNIRQSFKMSAGDIIHDAARGEMVKIMDNFYSVIRVKDIYGLKDGYDNIEDGILMWVESGECTYCLFVDELMGEQQVVVKPLPNYINNFNVKQRGITGCTILGDGNISVILDVSNLYSAVQ